jgi:hypothetical protein
MVLYDYIDGIVLTGSSNTRNSEFAIIQAAINKLNLATIGSFSTNLNDGFVEVVATTPNGNYNTIPYITGSCTTQICGSNILITPRANLSLNGTVVSVSVDTPANAFDGNIALDIGINGSGDAIGRIFTGSLYVNSLSFYNNSAVISGLKIQTYTSGVGWADSGANYNGPATAWTTIAISGVYQGVRLKQYINSSWNCTEVLIAGSNLGSADCFFNIPSGTFNTPPSSSIGVPRLVSFESGCDIQYRLCSGTETTPFMSCLNPSISSFSTMSVIPTTAVVRLIPASGGTQGVPAIRGFYVRAE